MTILMDDASRTSILGILDDARDLTIAVNRPDGFPQATVVSYVNDGQHIYFGCSKESQKFKNLRRDDRVSVTITPRYEDWTEIRGLSLGGRARPVENELEKMKVSELMLRRFPEIVKFIKIGEPEDIAMFRIDPEVISVLDYKKGFGHAELKTMALPAAKTG
jgi:nitroimidazol reductase NimA-like FMN-containing flavoprotein (pyridoxamine 5'-phosphate oxidase superfamily)